MPVVKFIKENKEIEVPSGANLRKEAIKAGINVHQGVNGIGAGINKFLNCHGIGQCGTCRVKITKGMENTNSMGMIESFRFHNPLPDPFPSLSYIGNEDTMRLLLAEQKRTNRLLMTLLVAGLIAVAGAGMVIAQVWMGHP